MIFISLTAILSISIGIKADMKNPGVNLPLIMGIWSRTDKVKMVDSKNIFEYMNGAGELYLAYNFDHLEVYEYAAKDQQNILVELYFMKSSDDAYGLLSQDWGGEPQKLIYSGSDKSAGNLASQVRALYGRGLLRIWSDNLYVRIMAFLETSSSKQVVLELGRLIMADRQNPLPPKLLNFLPARFGQGWKLLENTVSFFRSHLVLNSLYFLSHQNIFNLNLSTEACLSQYEKYPWNGKRKTFHVMVINYFHPGKALQALDKFTKIYLPEFREKQQSKTSAKTKGFFKIEDGWIGYEVEKGFISCIFGGPDKNTTRMVLDTLKQKRTKEE